MIRWRDDTDPATIPDEVLYAEAKRRPKTACVCGWVSEQTSRASLSRKTFAAGPGRPKKRKEQKDVHD